MKVIFVSNSPVVLENKLGNVIDSYDIVIRCNDFEIEGYEEHVGSKTDIWCGTGAPTHLQNHPMYRIRPWMDYHKNKFKPFKQIWTIRENKGDSLFIDNADQLPFFSDSNTEYRYVHKKMVNGQLKYVSPFVEKNVERLRPIKGNKRAPGTGFLTILNAVEQFGEITLYGNSFFKDSASKNSNQKLGKHYFTMDIEKYKGTSRYGYFKNQLLRENGFAILDYDTENQIVNELIDEGRITQLV